MENNQEVTSEQNQQQSDAIISYLSRLTTLLQNWQGLCGQLAQTFPDALESGVEPDEIMTQILIRDTTKLVMDSNWFIVTNDLKDKLLKEITASISLIGEENNLKFLLNILPEPWEKPDLEKILSGQEVTPQQVTALVESEGIRILEIRVEVLTSSKFENKALRLLRKLFQHCSHLPSTYLIDWYLKLLTNKQKLSSKPQHRVMSEIRNVLKSMPVDDIQNLIIRHSVPTCPSSQDVSVAQLASIFLFNCQLANVNVEAKDLKNIFSMWINLHHEVEWEQDLKQLIRRKCILPQNIYILCEIIYEEFGKTKLDLCVEILTCILTIDQNSAFPCEDAKQFKNIINQRRSKGFILLSKIFANNRKFQREIILTTFSIYPTPYTFSLVTSVSQVTTNNELNQNNVSFMNRYQSVYLNEDDIIHPDISSSNCDDVYTLVTSARWHFLSWQLNWIDLSTICLKYIENPGKMRADRELIHLEIDFSQFKSRPAVGEVRWIEAGYEGQLDTSSQTTRPKAKVARKKNLQLPKPKQRCGSRSKKETCDVCFITCKNRTSLMSHKYHKHIKNLNKGLGAKCYRCDVCLRDFETTQSLHDHKNSCPGMLLDIQPSTSQQQADETNLKCKYCNKLCRSSQRLIGHVNHSHPTSNKSDLACTTTQNKRDTSPKLQCAVCSNFYKNPASLSSHMRKFHADNKVHNHTDLASTSTQNKRDISPKLQCEFCSNLYKNPASLRSHINQRHADKVQKRTDCHTTQLQKKKKKLECNFCHKIFSTLIKLRIHMRKHIENHSAAKKQNVEPAQCPRSQCDVCRKFYKTAASLRTHIRQVHAHKVQKHADLASTSTQNKRDISPKLQCEFCSNLYKNPASLRSHINQRHADKVQKRTDCHTAQLQKKKKKLECNFCHNIFSTRIKLRIHMRKHIENHSAAKKQNVKPVHLTVKLDSLFNYSCRYCENQYKYKVSVRNHEKVYHGKKSKAPTSSPKESRMCKFCNEKFQFLSNHMKSQHKCKYCLKMFNDLKYHIDYNHYQVDKPNECICPVCQAHFKRNSILQHHLKSCLLKS